MKTFFIYLFSLVSLMRKPFKLNFVPIVLSKLIFYVRSFEWRACLQFNFICNPFICNISNPSSVFMLSLVCDIVLHNISSDTEDTERVNKCKLKIYLWHVIWFLWHVIFWFLSEFFIILVKVEWIANANNVWYGLWMINRKLIQSFFFDWSPKKLTCMCRKYLVKTFLKHSEESKEVSLHIFKKRLK